MLVFTYFFDKMPLLRDAINEKQRANEPETEVIAVDTDDDDVSHGISVILTNSVNSVLGSNCC